MHKPPGDGADQRSTRRRDQILGRDSERRRGTAAGSVFAPGYDASRPEPPDDAAAEPRASSPGSGWYGSTAGGAAGRGPVRGYPPMPGQPPPMYPPGQFAAWNRQPPGQGRPGETSQGTGRPAGGLPGGASGPHQALSATGTVRPDLDRPGNGYAPSPADPGQRGAATSRYYDQDFDTGAGPSYPQLAVSDPAADVTSTQTWEAAGEGRATGVWTTPSGRERDQAGAAGRDGGGRGAGALPRRSAPLDARDSGSRLRDSAGQAAGAGADTAASVASDRRTARGQSGAHSSPHAIPRRAAGRAGSDKHPPKPQPRRRRASGLRLAIVTAIVLVLAAVAALTYAALHHAATPKLAASGARRPHSSPSVSASASPSLGLYGHIATRKSDPTPLTLTELYPAAFTAGGTGVVRTAESKGNSSNCAADLVGSNIQSAIGSAGCTQVLRATYLASAPGVMGTIGVLNLGTAKAATSVARAADANNFIGQLAGRHGATTKIGQGTGIEEAAAKGHYLILIWAEFTNLHKPRTSAQLSTIEQFMSELLQNTANVSLTHRMLTGTA